jgi:Tfp pilus assembly protein FimT
MPDLLRRPHDDQTGYSLLELVFVIALLGTLGGMAVMQMGAIRPVIQGDSAMRVVMGQLNLARERAIAHRRIVEVTFVGSNSVRLTQHDLPSGTTEISTVPFEGRVQFGLLPGVPDTPDAFGNGAPIQFTSATLQFNTDGVMVNALGAPVNGTVFLLIPNERLSFRAVTVLGSTGRVRGYRWSGAAWTRG